MASLRLRHSASRVTSKVGSDLPGQLDAIDRRARAAADDFILRDAGNLSLYAGMSQQSISRQREYVPDVIPAMAKVARIVVAGFAIGRTFEDAATFLEPLTEAARGDLAPRLEIVGEIGDLRTTLETTIQEGAESAVAAMRLLDGATLQELATAEREAAQAIAAHQRLLAEVRARRVQLEQIHGSRAIQPA